MVCIKLGKLLVLTYLWLCWTTSIHVKATNDSLKPGDSLNATDGYLCSDNRKYCLGFTTYGSGGSGSYYLQIIDKENDWTVWVANRNQPFVNSTGLLSLNHSGVLKIESQEGEPIVLYSPPQGTTTNNIIATLFDTGNFVLHQLHPNGSTKSVLWQSFDYPTDTLLPGMKLGVNHKTGHNWSLVSWLSESVPGTGPFRLQWNHTTQELIITRQEQVYWTSGKLRNNRFEHISEQVQRIFNFIIVSNEEEDSFSFTYPHEKLTRWTILESGQLISSEAIDIGSAERCYGYNTDEGCQRWEIPTCRNTGDVFENRQGYPNFSDNTTSYELNTSYGIGDCRASCWSNCTCIGFQSWNDDGTGCVFFHWKTMEGINFASVGQSFHVLVKKPPHGVLCRYKKTGYG